MSRTPEEVQEVVRGYANDVLSGEVPACLYIRQACQRYLNDEEKSNTGDFPFRMDWNKAARAVRFVELMPHVAGKLAQLGELLRLEPWQLFIYANVFGWVSKETGLRRFRTVYIEVPRKNGKSAMASPVGLYCLAADGEQGAEVYSAASELKQAKIVYDTAHAMVEKSPQLRSALGVMSNSMRIYQPRSHSFFRALARAKKKGGGNIDGLNVHCGIVDELHAHPDASMWDVLGSGIGARSQPLIFAITTAGSDLGGVCYEQRSYLLKVLSGVISDDSLFGMVYTLDKEDDPYDHASWPKANPNWNVSVNPEVIQAAANKARQLPSARAEFLKKHLNVWGSADAALFDVKHLMECQDDTLKEDDFKGEQSVVGCDLASKDDFASACRLYRKELDGVDHFYAFAKHYTNENAVSLSPSPAVKGWAENGDVDLTKGAITDHKRIQEHILSCLQDGAQEVAFDPAQAWEISQNLNDLGYPVVEYRIGVRSMSEPTKELMALIKSGRFHFNDPVLLWMLSNVVGHWDAKEMVFPKKELAHAKIDGAIATIIALGRLMVLRPSSGFTFC